MRIHNCKLAVIQLGRFVKLIDLPELGWHHEHPSYVNQVPLRVNLYV